MKHSNLLYRNEAWQKFSDNVKKRDENRCLKCGRIGGKDGVVLQVHHTLYVPGKKPWEYALSACKTLCKGCHAREHEILPPNDGWVLLSVEDLGGLYGNCERPGCNQEIRYVHSLYHPAWGYLDVGSTCVDYLTKEEQDFAKETMLEYKKITKFVYSDAWEQRISENGENYLFAKYSYHKIEIYGNEFCHRIRLEIKDKGVNSYKTIKRQLGGKRTELVKELAYIAVRGAASTDENEKDGLRKLYARVRDLG